MDQQWPLPQKQAGTTPPDGGGRTPGIARYLETGQLQVIPPRRCLTENALSQRLLSQILQTAPLQGRFGKQGPTQDGRPAITVQDHLAAHAHGADTATSACSSTVSDTARLPSSCTER